MDKVLVRTSGAGNGGSSPGTATASGLSFASDPTAVGVDAAEITADGVAHEITYNPDGSAAEDRVTLPGTDVVRTINYGDRGVPYYSGNIMVQGAWRMTEAQALEFVTEVLSPAGSAAAGFRMRITDLSYRIDASGTTIYKDAEFEWDGEQLTAVRSVYRETLQTATHTGGLTKTTLRSLTFPGWLLGNSNVIVPEVVITAAGASSTIRGHIEIGSTDFSGALSGSGAAVSAFLGQRIRQIGGSNQIAPPPASGGAGGYVLTASAYLAPTLNPASSHTFDYKVTLGDIGQTATLRYAGWRLLPPGM